LGCATMIVREKTGHVARVTMARPAKHNALTAVMWADLRDAFLSLAADPEVRVVVLQGAGGRAFSVGADIAEFGELRTGLAMAATYDRVVQQAIMAVRTCPQPTIAAIRGLCVGGGLEIATACDLRVATLPSLFGVPVKKLGLAVAYPELESLVRLVGDSNALELLYEGRLMEAPEALEKGLINRAIVEDEYVDVLAGVIERIVSGAPLVSRLHKQMTQRIQDARPLTEAERGDPLAMFDTEDYKIGTRAFLEKRSPKFVGR
jgi:enoyl-CoA hydratase